VCGVRVQLVQEKDVAAALPLAVSLGKAVGADYFGLAPRAAQASAAAAASEPQPPASGAATPGAVVGSLGVQAIPPEQQAGFLRMFRSFYAQASARLLDEHKVNQDPLKIDGCVLGPCLSLCVCACRCH
jgi:hypothetical protein